MKKSYNKNNKFSAFLKKNIYYVVMAICVLAIGTMVTVALVNTNQNDLDVGGGNIIPTPDPNPNPNPTPDPTPEPEPVTPMVFNYPLANGNVIRVYAKDEHVWNATLNQYSTHLAIDFGGKEGNQVLAVFEGVVESISEDPLNGKMVVIKHKDNVKTIYSSLGEVTVTKDQQVTKGQTIGTIGVTMMTEALDGVHLHFEVSKNGEFVDPNLFFPEGDK